MKKMLLSIICICILQMAYAENGSSLWLRYEQGNQSEIYSNKNTPTLQTAIQVLKEAWKGAPVTSITTMSAMQEKHRLTKEKQVFSSGKIYFGT